MIGSVKVKNTVFFCLALCLASSAVESKEVFRKAGWAVRADVDPMTDKKRCFAVYVKRPRIQASIDDFFIDMKGRGGVAMYRVRIDDRPADDARSATSDEKELDVLMLRYYLPELYAGKRLRVQIHALLNNIEEEDVDLNGFRNAVDFMKEIGCT
jgi:hypothetical protein